VGALASTIRKYFNRELDRDLDPHGKFIRIH